MDLERVLPALLSRHPAVMGVALAGSRAEGRAHARSDWDFAVRTSSLEELRRALPELLAPLEPLARQWDRYSEIACYMLMLRGPVKVDLLFPDERQEWAPPWTATAATLPAIDDHFWDWALWLAQKAEGAPGRVPSELAKLHELLLAPLGVEAPPASVTEAVAAYVAARGDAERRLGVRVPRRLEDEVRPAFGGRTPPSRGGP